MSGYLSTIAPLSHTNNNINKNSNNSNWTTLLDNLTFFDPTKNCQYHTIPSNNYGNCECIVINHHVNEDQSKQIIETKYDYSSSSLYNSNSMELNYSNINEYDFKIGINGQKFNKSFNVNNLQSCDYIDNDNKYEEHELSSFLKNVSSNTNYILDNNCTNLTANSMPSWMYNEVYQIKDPFHSIKSQLNPANIDLLQQQIFCTDENAIYNVLYPTKLMNPLNLTRFKGCEGQLDNFDCSENYLIQQASNNLNEENENNLYDEANYIDCDDKKSKRSFYPRRNHQCDICGRYYTRKYGLKIHMRIHTGFKPLSCEICGKKFGDPSNMAKHKRLHANGINKSPYNCDQCGKILVRRRDLERHMRSRHPETFFPNRNFSNFFNNSNEMDQIINIVPLINDPID